MLIVISPAKTLDYDTPPITKNITTPDYLDYSQQLIDILRNYSALDISEMMKTSMKISELNFERYHHWKTPFTAANAKQALLAFKGDVYTGLDAESFKAADLKFAQDHLRMLSGLYGLLRPLDLMQPYRLEMGTKLKNLRGNNLYDFWGDIITDGLNKQLKKIKSEYLINLASNEYFKSVKPKLLNAKIITPEFKDYKNGEYKMIGIYAKKARGAMSRFIIKNQLSHPDDIKNFDLDGYKFNSKNSTSDKFVFTRRKVPAS
jgi:cytoplasmic iron level regulating protein YaaA (DUF328/UPF0246 family)